MLRRSLCMVLLASVAWASPGAVLSDSEHKALTEESSNRDAKLFPIVQIVTFENSPCTQANGGQGVCYSESECKSLEGEASGTCAKGYGVCCSLYKSSGTISQNGTYFTNKAFPGSYSQAGMQMVELEPPAGTCQIRLDFANFNIVGPNEGECSNDTFVVTGANSRSEIPVLCGENGGQHMYIDVDNTDDPIKLIVTTSSVNYARQWKVLVTFIGEDDPCKAPNRCLQYHKDTTGEIQSFNYVAPGNAGMLLNNLKYSICFAYVKNYCDIGLNFDRFDIGNLQECTNDYLGVGPEKFCGDFIDYGLLANATGPISLLVNTDDNNEREEEGFSGSYAMLGC